MTFVPIKWLGEHVKVPADLTATQLASDLVKVGLEEEAIHTSGVVGPLVCGQVISMVPEAQSNGKTINYCRVNVGDKYNDAPGEGKEPAAVASRSIVCGAHNFKPGDHVVVVLPGAVLPGNFQISARKTYGHISDGMICSLRELGLGQDHDGIIVLEDYLSGQVPPVGTNMLPILGLADELLEINITPDRGYCFSMRGIAREYSHSTGADFIDPGLAQNVKNAVNACDGKGFEVQVNDDAPIRQAVGCDRFVTRIVRGVNPAAASPKWMVERLEQAGMRSISLAVDVTNYVMLDLGQPMHAYDLATLVAPIVVRRARAGESLITLDEVNRELDPQDLLITDSTGSLGGRVIGLAGVMGGASTEVSETTTDILLEAAHFAQVSIARTARRHKLSSEASKRFERGVDPLLAPVAAQVAANLLVQYGGGTIDSYGFDFNQVPEIKVIRLDSQHPTRLIGLEISDSKVVEYLEMIGCQVNVDDSELLVTPPSWRPDLVGWADLIEEIARLAGYHNVPSIMVAAPAGTGITPLQKARRLVAQTLAQAGLSEVLSYPFIPIDRHKKMGMTEGDTYYKSVSIANPLSDDAPDLRTRILDTLLATAGLNHSRSNQQVALFEVGMVTLGSQLTPAPIPGVETKPSLEEFKALRAGVPKQPWKIGLVLCGPAVQNSPLAQSRPWDWADAIDLVVKVASALGVAVTVQSDPIAPWHPGRCAGIWKGELANGKAFAHAGELHPTVCKEFGLPPRSCAAEINLDALIKAMPKNAVQVKPVSTFPVAKEDFAFVVDSKVTAYHLRKAIEKAGGQILESVRLFDEFAGEQLGEGKKSLAFAVTLRAADHTLSAEEISQTRAAIIKTAEKTCQAILRS